MDSYGVTDDRWFWGNVFKTDDCWIWTGERTPDGYGVARYRELSGYAHRVSYQMHHGEIPIGHVVRHSCDVPYCVAPHHLSTGTQVQNMQDMVARGRGRRRVGAHAVPEEAMPRLTDAAADRAVVNALEERGRITVGEAWTVLVTAGWPLRTAKRRVSDMRRRGVVEVDQTVGLRVYLRLPEA